VTLVPIKEMAGVLTVHQKVAELSMGAWVRVKGGPYAGDLAQVSGAHPSCAKLPVPRCRAPSHFTPRHTLTSSLTSS